MRANHYIEANEKYTPDRDAGIGSLDSDSIDGDFPYDNMSQSSYGSHKNRNFESRSHQGGSLSELRNEEENEKLQLLTMTGTSAIG